MKRLLFYQSIHRKFSEVFNLFLKVLIGAADPGGRAVYGVGPRPPVCRYCGFESRRRHGCLSVMSVVCCQVEISASG
jgi:hypothetical protein